MNLRDPREYLVSTLRHLGLPDWVTDPDDHVMRLEELVDEVVDALMEEQVPGFQETAERVERLREVLAGQKTIKAGRVVAILDGKED